MDIVFQALMRLRQLELTAVDYLSIAFFILTALLLLLTYGFARQKWVDIAAWSSLGWW